MGKYITVLSIGLLAGSLITFAAIFIVLPRQIFVVKESKLSFEDTITTLAKSAEASDWTIPQQYNLQATLKKNGYETEPVVVISMCNPLLAEKILNSDKNRFVSAMMPCRLSVFETNGKTYTSMLNAKLFYPFMKKEAKETIKAANIESLKILKSINF